MSKFQRIFEKVENDLAGHLLGKEVQLQFLSVNDVLALHEQVVARFGGSAGVRDMGLLQSAVHRPMQAASYADLSAPEAASLLAQGIIKNHAFLDGNKRSGLFSLVVMLDQNGYDFEAEAPDIVFAIKGLAAGDLSPDQFTQWVVQRAVPRETQQAQNRPESTK